MEFVADFVESVETDPALEKKQRTNAGGAEPTGSHSGDHHSAAAGGFQHQPETNAATHHCPGAATSTDC